MIGTWPSTIADLIVRLAQVAACEIALTQAGDSGAGCSVGEPVAGLD